MKRSPALDAPLRCRFLHRGDPYLRLAPFKMEEWSEHPFVAAFHDFMSDSEVEHYKAEAVKNMIRKGQPHFNLNPNRNSQ